MTRLSFCATRAASAEREPRRALPSLVERRNKPSETITSAESPSEETAFNHLLNLLNLSTESIESLSLFDRRSLYSSVSLRAPQLRSTQVQVKFHSPHISSTMHLLYYSLSFALPILAASPTDDSKHPHVPCTIRSPSSGAFFDLNTVHVELPPEGKKAPKDARNASWPARGYDYGANFTLNFCGPVVENLEDVVGVEKSRWQNVSAYYELDGKIYSIG